MEKVTRGSDNVLADLGVEGAEELSIKVQLAVAMNRIIQGRHLKQAEIAALLGISQPRVSGLVNYKLDGFSVERLMHFLTALDRDVEIRIRKKPRSRQDGRILVTG
jgi:predicted XRE-type DNA-binding protein